MSAWRGEGSRTAKRSSHAYMRCWRRSVTIDDMRMTIRLLREADGRWIADVPELPGVTVYGGTSQEATLKAKALALRVIAEEIENGELPPEADTMYFSFAA